MYHLLFISDANTVANCLCLAPSSMQKSNLKAGYWGSRLQGEGRGQIDDVWTSVFVKETTTESTGAFGHARSEAEDSTSICEPESRLCHMLDLPIPFLALQLLELGVVSCPCLSYTKLTALC